MNEDYYINQINHLRAVIDELEKKNTKNNIYNIMNQTIDESFWVADLDLNITFVSNSIEKIIGYTHDELMGSNLKNYLTDESISELNKKLKEELGYIEKNPKEDPDHFVRLILSFKHKNKDMTIWCEVKIRFLLNDKYKPVSILGTTKDITEQKLIEENLYKNMGNNDEKLKKEISALKKELKETKAKLKEALNEIEKLKSK